MGREGGRGERGRESEGEEIKIKGALTSRGDR